jgi:hypothetical protein
MILRPLHENKGCGAVHQIAGQAIGLQHTGRDRQCGIVQAAAAGIDRGSADQDWHRIGKASARECGYAVFVDGVRALGLDVVLGAIARTRRTAGLSRPDAYTLRILADALTDADERAGLGHDGRMVMAQNDAARARTERAQASAAEAPAAPLTAAEVEERRRLIAEARAKVARAGALPIAPQAQKDSPL